MENNKKSNGISTKSSARKQAVAKSAPAADLMTEKKKISPTAIVTIATAAVLLVVLLVLAILFAVDSYRKDEGFDYVHSNLANYVNLSRDDYKNYTLELDLAKPREKDENGNGVSDVEVAILNMIASQKSDTPIDGVLRSSITVTPGDTVYLWYRGYILDEEGKQVEVNGMSNFSQDVNYITSASNALTIGSGKFVPGFELGLVGKCRDDYAKFSKITSGTVTEEHVVYLDYTRVEEGKENKETGKAMRIDLTDPGMREKWGDILLGKKVGDVLDFDITVGDTKYTYSATEISFLTTCETDAANPPLVVTCYFPYDYSVSVLKNQTAYFEVYIEKVMAYNDWHTSGNTEYDYSYDWNDEFVAERVALSDSAITMEQLQEYEGDTLTAKYEAYAKEYLDDAYETVRRSLIEDAMWDHYLSKVDIKRFPGIKVDEIYNEYYNDVVYQFEMAGGADGGVATIYDSFNAQDVMCETIDEYAIIYLGLQFSSNQDWKNVLYKMSESLVAERLILYYIMQQENLTPTEQVLNDRIADLKQEYLDEYVDQYLEKYEKTRDDYTDEEYEEFLKNREEELYDYYDEAYFTETAYYNIVLDTLITYPTIKTFDDKK